MLQIIFGDDEHTAVEGPYNRLLKTRKWLYLTSLAGIAIDLGLYRERASVDLLKIIFIPTSQLRQAVIIGLAYLLLQYAFLIVQLVATYDIILDERLQFRRSDELSAARERVKAANEELRSCERAFADGRSKAREIQMEELSRERDAVSAALRQARRELDAINSHQAIFVGYEDVRYTILRNNSRLELIEERLADLAGGSDVLPTNDPGIRAALQSRNEAVAAWDALEGSVPATRTGYQSMERVIDLFRIGVPFGVAVIALRQLLT